jgi:CRISPR-associated protein Csd1
MILQALYQLYGRLAEDPASGLPKPGYSLQGISFKVVLHPDGRLLEIAAVKDEKGRSVSVLVPGMAKPSGAGINPCFLWDNTGYMLGFKVDDPKPERSLKSFEAFKERHLAAEKAIGSGAFSAVCRFLEAWNPAEAGGNPTLAQTKTGFGVFQIAGEPGYVHDAPAVRQWWESQSDSAPKEGENGICLITGKEAALAQLHDPAIKGVAGAQSSGAKLVSFNLDAFSSYGKEQSFNAPAGEEAAFAYCNALNHLLASDRRRFRVGDATTVFWTEKPERAEDLLPFLVDAGKTPEDEGLKQRLAAVMEKIADGKLSGDDLGDAGTRFYLLGLSPNASRLSVRFWHTSTLGELAANLQKHHSDLAIVRQWDETNSKNPDPKVPGLYALLRQTARDADGIPPLLGGALMRAILLGTNYPDAFFQKVMSRVRVAEKDQNGNPTDRVTYLRAAIIKAFLNRNHQHQITMSLDITRTDTAYLLGRLFAVLEKTQQDALPEINATIRDRFYSGASATPGAVFPRILRTYQHHLGKLEGGHKVVRERLVQEIMESLTGFPGHLNLQQQGQFAIGYYHQRKDFFTKKPAGEEAAG